jgi:hypothetical protein
MSTVPSLTRTSPRTASKKAAPQQPRVTPRPWLINLVARALRLASGNKSSCTIGVQDNLDKLTRLATTSVWNAIRVLEFRGWIKKQSNYIDAHGKQSAANTYQFTPLFPYPADYFTQAQRDIAFEISEWPGTLKARDISILWGLARHVDQHRRAHVSRQQLCQELDFGVGRNLRRRSVSVANRFRSLAGRKRLRIHRTKSGTGTWNKNEIQLAGPSGFLSPSQPAFTGPIPAPNTELRNRLFREVKRRAGSDGYAFQPQRKYAADLKASEKAIKGLFRSMVRSGVFHCKPRNPTTGTYLNGYKVLRRSLPNPPAQIERENRHQAAIDAGRNMRKFCNAYDELGVTYPGDYDSWTAALDSQVKTDYQLIKKEKSRAHRKNWH